MQLNTVNVIVLNSGGIEGNVDIASFPNTDEGIKEAEALFSRLTGLDSSEDEEKLEDALYSRSYEGDDGEIKIVTCGICEWPRKLWKS